MTYEQLKESIVNHASKDYELPRWKVAEVFDNHYEVGNFYYQLELCLDQSLEGDS